MQHVRVGQHPVGVRPRPVTLGQRGVAVVGAGPQAGQPERFQRFQLVGAQRLGRREVEHAGPRVGRQGRQRRQLVGQGLARMRCRWPPRRRARRAPGRPPAPDGTRAVDALLAAKRRPDLGGTQAGQSCGRPGRHGNCSTWVMDGVTDVTDGPLHRFSTPSRPSGSAQAFGEVTASLSRRRTDIDRQRHVLRGARRFGSGRSSSALRHRGALPSALEYTASRRATGGRRVRPAPVRNELAGPENMHLAWIRSSMSSQIAADLEVTGSDQAILIGVAVIAVIALVIAFVLRAGVLAAGKGTPEDAGDLRGRPGGCRRLSRPAVPHPRCLRRDRLRAALRAAGGDHQRADRPVDRVPVRRGVLRRDRLLRHVAGHPRQRPGRRRRQR